MNDPRPASPREDEDPDTQDAGPVTTWVLSYPPARAWICNNDLLCLALDDD